MGTVVIVPLTTEVGHLNPTLGLARALGRGGHRVCYLALRELEPNIRQQGLEYQPLLGQVRLEVPPGKGWLGQHPIPQMFRELRARLPWNNTMLELMLAGQAGAELVALQPDLVLVDNMWPQLALVARQQQLPVALLATTPGFRRGQAPLRGAALLAHRALGGLSRALGLRFRESTLALAERCGIPASSFDLEGLLPRFTGPELPELLLYPTDLEDPDAAPGLHVGPSVDLERAEPPFDMGRIPPGHDLIYCALGTRELSRSEALALFRPIIEAVSRRPGTTLVLAAGAHGKDLGQVPEQVLVVDRAPQLALLRRAKLMLTHGGLGSIKECLYFQVPMVVLPLRFDQEANAARVHRQHLGLSLRPGQRSAASISQAVDTVLGDPTYRASVAVVGARMQASEAQAAGITQVEALIRGQAKTQQTA